MKNNTEFRDLLEMFVQDVLSNLEDELFVKNEEKHKNDIEHAFNKMNNSRFKCGNNSLHPEHEKVYPIIVKEALVSYKKILENERETCISSCTKELDKVSLWIKEKMEEEKKYSGDNPIYDPSEVLDRVMKGMKKDAISKSTYYTDKINQINFILEKYTFEDK